MAQLSELHNRARTRDLKVTYTNGQKRYLRPLNRVYEPNRLCPWLIHHTGNPKEATKAFKIGLYDHKTTILLTPGVYINLITFD